jgi:hypothetical protein
MAFVTLTDSDNPDNLWVINLDQIVSMYVSKNDDGEFQILNILLTIEKANIKIPCASENDARSLMASVIKHLPVANKEPIFIGKVEDEDGRSIYEGRGLLEL